MKRWGTVVSVLAVLGVGAGTAAAQATATASIHRKAPSSISASKKFRVKASGTAPMRADGTKRSSAWVFEGYQLGPRHGRVTMKPRRLASSQSAVQANRSMRPKGL